MPSSDYEDLFSALNAHKIKYLVIGAHAVIFYSEPRFTKDLDIWIPAELNDPRSVYKALKFYGAPLKGVRPGDFQDQSVILQIGIAPVRVDILIKVPGVSAIEAWKHRRHSRYGKIAINIMGLDELILSKKASGRPQDKLDLARIVKKRKSGYS
ncbi:MAG: hypothetical protein HYY14_07205 [Candidatus Omnitrophica bacterium]|nr:hypothetical protein [Candidatus Omnitrophota bacterium]